MSINVSARHMLLLLKVSRYTIRLKYEIKKSNNVIHYRVIWILGKGRVWNEIYY